MSVSTCEGDVYVFDIRIKPEIVLDGGLIRLLQSVELVKVICITTSYDVDYLLTC